jgi:hypothetical protein
MADEGVDAAAADHSACQSPAVVDKIRGDLGSLLCLAGQWLRSASTSSFLDMLERPLMPTFFARR